MKKIVRNVKKAAAKAVNDAGKAGGKAINDTGKAAGKAIKDTGNAVGKAVNDIGNELGRTFAGGKGGEPTVPPGPGHFITGVAGEPCGPLRLPFTYLKNSHPDRGIRVFVAISAQGSPKPPVQKHYDVRPQAQIPMGCAVPGPTLQRFDYRIIGYEWLN